MSIFNHYSLTTYLAEIRDDKDRTLKELSDSVGITPQGVGLIFNGQERLVINHLAGWKRALKLKRLEGVYFELLAILAAFATSANPRRLRERALDLVQKLAERGLPDPVPNSLVYWISAECSLLRNLVDLADCPVEEVQIPKWAARRAECHRLTRGYSYKELERRFEKSWQWLINNKAVALSPVSGHWEKTQPVFLSPGRITPEIQDFQSSILKLPHSDVHLDFARQLGTSALVLSKVATLPIPKKLESLIHALGSEFLETLIHNLNAACNSDEMARLAATEPERHQQLKTYLVQLKARGFEVPECADDDFDTVIQFVCGIRHMTE